MSEARTVVVKITLSPGTCFCCGCTEDAACPPEGCAWADDTRTVCSRCVGIARRYHMVLLALASEEP